MNTVFGTAQLTVREQTQEARLKKKTLNMKGIKEMQQGGKPFVTIKMVKLAVVQSRAEHFTGVFSSIREKSI